jgi:hypothetical protein
MNHPCGISRRTRQFWLVCGKSSILASRLLKGIDSSAIAKLKTAIGLDKFLPDPSGIAELTKAMFAGLAAPESLRAMERFAKGNHDSCDSSDLCEIRNTTAAWPFVTAQVSFMPSRNVKRRRQ